MLFKQVIPFALALAPAVLARRQIDVRMPLPGDLKNGVDSDAANDIVLIINGMVAGENNTKGPVPTGEQCEKNKCCKWYGITDVLTNLFKDNGKCNDLSRAAVRLGFHDAGTWSAKLAAKGQDYGGADGSIYLFEEYKRPENKGLETVSIILGELAQNKGVSVADMIQWASAHATVTCDLGPRMRTFVGRKDGTQASPDGLLPDVRAPAEELDNLFRDKHISPHDLAALVGAHSSAKQFHVDTTRAGQPLDSTPEVWDVALYEEVLEGPVNGTIHLASDIALANYEPVRDEWVRFINDQHHWNEDYAKAYLRLSLLGVNNINADIFECTDALPPAHYSPGEEGIPDQDEFRRMQVEVAELRQEGNVEEAKELKEDFEADRAEKKRLVNEAVSGFRK